MRAICYLLAIIAAVMLLWGCSGTETGNPDISFSAKVVFDAYDSSDTWMPENYLRYGSEQLSPGVIYSDIELYLLRKTALSSQTQADSLVWIDTVIVVNPVIVTDTIITYKDEVDTLLNDEGDTVVVTKRLSDYYIVNDTVFFYETTFVERTLPVQGDSLQIVLSASQADSVSTYLVDGVPMNKVYFRVSNDITEFVYMPSSNYQVVSTANMAHLSRRMVKGDTVAFEDYSDADGDSLLFRYKQSKGPLVNLYAEYDVPGKEKTTIKSLFDGGDDMEVKTSANNRIHSLERQIIGATTSEKLLFETDVKNGMPKFTLNKIFKEAPLESLTIKCDFAGPADDHRAATLFKIRKNLFYRSGELNRMDLELAFSEPVGYQERGGDCYFTLNTELFGGVKGRFEGRVLNGGTQIMGIYIEGNRRLAVQAYKDGRIVFTDLN